VARGNVLFVTVDQWRGDCLSVAGHPVVATPAADAVAARGVRFANHWSVTAPCGPSRASMHTGLYLMHHRSVNNGTPLADRFTNMAREARTVGYDPTLFGYTDTTVDPRLVVDPDDPRLRTYEGVLPGYRAEVAYLFEEPRPWAEWVAAQGGEVPPDPFDLYAPIPDYPGADEHGPSWAPTRHSAEHSEAAFLTTRFCEWLDRRDDEPWFAHISYIGPHPPYRASEGFHDLYSPDAGPPFRRLADRDAEINHHPVHWGGSRRAGCPVDEDEARQLRATYWGKITETDAQLARLFEHLAASGHGDDTLVVLTSDHGDQMGDHWLVEKLGWWDESYHVPLIVVDPRPEADATRGSVVTAFTEAVDLMPTVCEWMGVEVPVAVDGRALQPFLHQGAAPPDWRTAAHWQWDFRDPVDHIGEDILGVTMEQCTIDVIRTEDHKYVHVGDGSFLFYDLAADPDQLHDLAPTMRSDPTVLAAVADARAELLAWRMRHDDRTLTGHLATPEGMVVRRDPRR
jgi:arylsulfatase A-like enzyme